MLFFEHEKKKISEMTEADFIDLLDTDFESGISDHPGREPRPLRPPRKIWPDLASSLDIRVGRIVYNITHKVSRKYIVQQVDFGEELERPAIGRFRPYFKRLETMDKFVVCVCNINFKIMWYISDCFILMAKTADKMELLEPPMGACVGARVVVPGFPYRGQGSVGRKAFIKPRSAGKRLLDTVLKDFRVNEVGVAEYRGIPLRTLYDNYITARTLTNCAITR